MKNKYVTRYEDNPITKENVLELIEITKEAMSTEEPVENWLLLPKDWDVLNTGAESKEGMDG